ncbi:hypothetical protein ACVIHI_002721 [Bradyrhizobium sp. USDA 4524]|nr:hypothetical protein [Bradyrhizobium sp. USDA 4538]MCP1904923.1 hypothetical protein [Bradyrhizobium sp. USDA 4537]MCP1915761.1 hypothetical protein [Bradyrhizobium elkanii]MCP1989421.1 hypothetical protein [Bradyrhizobium sp. USDA 4539]
MQLQLNRENAAKYGIWRVEPAGTGVFTAETDGRTVL